MTEKQDRASRREIAARDALRTLLRDLHFERFGYTLPAKPEEEIVLRLRVRPAENWSVKFDPALSEQIAPQLENWQAGRNQYREGRVYCFRCETAECEHAVPSSLTEVFAGYAPNGVPEWQELAQALLAAGDERVGELYAERSRAIALFTPGHVLRARQLASFGRSSRTYAILAQAVVGFFPVREAVGQRLALTFQVVETRDARGEPAVRLNVISPLPTATLREWVNSGWEPVLERAWKTAERAVEEVQNRVREALKTAGAGAASEEYARVPGILNHLIASIERGQRQAARRTRHAEQRRQERRPVHKALEDAREAQPGLVFEDLRAKTMIVCGPQARAHAFTSEGRHVTSFTVRPSAIEFRLRRRRWRVMTPDEVREFKARIAGLSADQKDNGPPD